MGLFSKLFGDANRHIINNLTDEMLRNSQKQQQSQYSQDNHSPNVQSYQQEQKREESPSGFSWGVVMPDEPNQYNYPGTYIQYFEEIFYTTFPGYQIQRNKSPFAQNEVFTFYQNGRSALVVELLSKSSSVTRLRNECRKSGIPYLRYYYNVDGWWNTREYVITRTRSALGI